MNSMEAEFARHLRQIFEQVVELPEEDQEPRLQELCGQDEEMYRQVKTLLQAYKQTSDFLETPAIPPQSPIREPANELTIPERLGAYRIIKKIGQGGMGVVFLAVRDDEQFNRRVAIKIAPQAVDDASWRERFDTERRILASLEHPNIARLYDGGVSEDGLPYLVMEYVDGLPVDLWCRRQGLSLHQRLALFIKICSAVEYAHQHLVVHRDIKPGNILITPEGEPKLLDFGVARVLGAGTVAPGTAAMRSGLLTPEYASPEQINNEPVTTASDVYSLGILLYKLLTGRHPYQQHSTPDKLMQAIREKKPDKPSVIVLTSENQTRSAGHTTRPADQGTTGFSTQPGRLGRMLKGDLDSIVLKAVRKEPRQRYETVSALAEDIRLFLANRPVKAQPDTFFYRAKKYIRRNRGIVSALSVAVLSLLGGLIVASRSAQIADQQRAKAQHHFESLRTLASSFLFDFYDEIARLPGATHARELVITTALQYLQLLSEEASDDPSIMYDVALAYERIGGIQSHRYYASKGNIEAALDSYRNMQRILRTLHNTHPDNAKFIYALGWSHQDIADVYAQQGKTRESYDQYIEGMKLFLLCDSLKWRPEKTDYALLVAYQRLGDTAGNPRFNNLGDREKAMEWYQKMLAIMYKRQNAAPENPDAAHTISIGMEKLADLQLGSGDTEAVVKLYGRALTIRDSLAQAYPDNAWYKRDLAIAQAKTAMAQAQLGLLRKAEENFLRARAIHEQRIQNDKTSSSAVFDLISVLTMQGDTHLNDGKPEKAFTLYAQSARLFTSKILTKQTTRIDFSPLIQSLNKAGQAGISSADSSSAAKTISDIFTQLQNRIAGREMSPAALNEIAWTMLTCRPSSARHPRHALALSLQAAEKSSWRDANILDTVALAWFENDNVAQAVRVQQDAIALLPQDSQMKEEFSTRLERYRSALRRQTPKNGRFR